MKTDEDFLPIIFKRPPPVLTGPFKQITEQSNQNSNNNMPEQSNQNSNNNMPESSNQNSNNSNNSNNNNNSNNGNNSNNSNNNNNSNNSNGNGGLNMQNGLNGSNVYGYIPTPCVVVNVYTNGCQSSNSISTSTGISQAPLQQSGVSINHAPSIQPGNNTNTFEQSSPEFFTAIPAAIAAATTLKTTSNPTLPPTLPSTNSLIATPNNIDQTPEAIAAAIAAATESNITTNNLTVTPNNIDQTTEAITAAATAAATAASGNHPNPSLTPPSSQSGNNTNTFEQSSPKFFTAIPAAIAASNITTNNLTVTPNNIDQTTEAIPAAAIAAAIAASGNHPNNIKDPAIPSLTQLSSQPVNNTNTFEQSSPEFFAAIPAAIAAATTLKTTSNPTLPSTNSLIATPNNIDQTHEEIAAAIAAATESNITTNNLTVTPNNIVQPTEAITAAATAAATAASGNHPNNIIDNTKETVAKNLLVTNNDKIKHTTDDNLTLIRAGNIVSYVTPGGIVYYTNGDDPTIYEYEQNYDNKDVVIKRKATVENHGDAQVVKINDTPVTETNFKELYPETIKVYGETDIKGVFEKITPFSIKAIQLLQKRIDERDTFDQNKYLSYITNQGIGYYRKKDGTDAKIYEYEQVKTDKPDRRIASLGVDGNLRINIDGKEIVVDVSNYDTTYPETFKVYGYDRMPDTEKSKILEITKQNFIAAQSEFNNNMHP